VRRDLVVGLAAGAVALLLFLPAASAQDDAGLVEHLEGHAADAQRDPPGFATNATTPEWQRGEFNFTVAWTCGMSARTPARAVLEGAGACQRLRDVAAVEDEEEVEEPDAEAEAEEPNEAEEALAAAEEVAEEGAEALADAVEAAKRFADGAAADPGNALAHLRAFLARLVDILLGLVRGLLGLVLAVPLAMLDAVLTAADLVLVLVGALGEGLGRLANVAGLALDEARDLALRVVAGVHEVAAELVGNVRDAALAVVRTVAGAVVSVVRGATHALVHAADAAGAGITEVANAAQAAVRELLEGFRQRDDAAGASGGVGDKLAEGTREATGLVDGVVDALPI